MLAVQFSNCENLRISFERTGIHNKEMNGTITCAYLSALPNQNCLRLFLSDSHGTYFVHFQTIAHIIILGLFSQLQ